MTARCAVVPRMYRWQEGSRSYHRYASFGLLLAVFLHLGMIGAYQVLQSLSPQMKFGSRIGPRLPHGPVWIPDPVEEFSAGGFSSAITSAKGIPIPVPQTRNPMKDISFDPADILTPGGTNVAGYGQGSGTSDDPYGGDEPLPEGNDEPVEIFNPGIQKLPVAIRQITPEYPEMGRRALVEGTVVLRCLVSKDGRVSEALISQSDSEILNDAAIEAARQWLFTPAIMNDRQVAVWVSIPFRFRLSK